MYYLILLCNSNEVVLLVITIYYRQPSADYNKYKV